MTVLDISKATSLFSLDREAFVYRVYVHGSEASDHSVIYQIYVQSEAERMSLNSSPPVKLDHTINTGLVKHNVVFEAIEASPS